MSKYLITFTWHYKAKEASGNWYIGKPTTQTYFITKHPAIWWDETLKEAYDTEENGDEGTLTRGFSVYDSLNFFAEIPDIEYEHLENIS